MGIKIYDFYPNSDAQFLKETTASEMSSIMGGFGRRRRRNRNTNTENSGDISSLLEDINTNLDQWRTEIDSTLDDLRQAINF